MTIKHIKTFLFCVALCAAMTTAPKQVQASDTHMGDIFAAVILTVGGAAAMNLTSIVASSVYLGKGKHSPLGWQIFSYTVGGFTVGTGIAVLAGEDLEVGSTILAIGATTLTLSILAATRNKPKKKPSVAFAPVLLRDLEGGLAPGVGFSLLSF